MASKKFITLMALFILMLLFASSKLEFTGVAEASRLGSKGRKLDENPPDTPDTPPPDTPEVPDTPPPYTSDTPPEAPDTPDTPESPDTPSYEPPDTPPSL